MERSAGPRPPGTEPGEERPAPDPVDPDLARAVEYSLAQTVEARLRGVRNYTRLLRETQRQAGRPPG